MKNALRNWKTTSAGIGAILLAVGAVLTGQAQWNDPAIMAAVLAGLGNIFAKDADKSGTATGE